MNLPYRFVISIFFKGYGSKSTSDLYKLILVAWIMLALGYWVMLLNFLQKAIKSNVPRTIKRGLKSKRIARQAEFLRELIAKVRLEFY